MFRYEGQFAETERSVIFVGPELFPVDPIPIFGETSNRQILSLTPSPLLIGFFITTTLVMSAKHIETGEIKIARSKPFVSTGLHFIDGVLYDKARLRKEKRLSGHLRTAMLVEGLDHAVKARDGSFYPFIDGRDVIIPA